ncbi:hypothetical protein HNV12_27955 [Methanococcoides sp. SA1]|nr:hypothetical protein [Methanococcoides sp. SA1]
MKPDLDYYNIPELMERWSEHDIKGSDLLQYGASRKLQFSIWIAPPTGIHHTLYFDCFCYEDGDSIPLTPTNTNYLTHNNPKLFKVTSQTIRRILSKTRPNNDPLHNHSDAYTEAAIMPDCAVCYFKCHKKSRREGISINCLNHDTKHDDECATCDTKCPKQTLPDKTSVYCVIRDTRYCNENGDEALPKDPININELLTITARDLVVTIDEVKRFEREQEITKTNLPLCVTPGTFGYSQHMAIALEIWESVFIKQEILNTTSPNQAGIAYIDKHYKSLGIGEKRKDHISTIALQAITNTADNRKAWSDYLEKLGLSKKSQKPP